MIKLLLITIVLISIAVLGLSVRMLFKRGGKFPVSQIGHNKVMRKKGINCYSTQDKVERKKTVNVIPGMNMKCDCSEGCQ